MKINLFLGFVCFSLLASCNHKKASTVKMEPIQKADSTSITYLKNTSLAINDTIRLSQLAEEVTYVSLDLPNTSKVIQIQYTDSFIFVNDNTAIHWFNHKGKEINKIPLSSGCFDLSNHWDSIYTYSLSQKRINCYDLKGNRIWTSRLHYKEKAVGLYGHFFAHINDSLFVIANTNEGFNPDKLVFFNERGRMKAHIPNNETFPYPGSHYTFHSDWYRRLTKNKDVVFYHPVYNDTVYQVGGDMHLTPVIIEERVKKVPLTSRPEYTAKKWLNFLKECQAKQLYVIRVFNTSRYVVVEYRLGGITYSMANFLVYDRKDKVLRRTFNDLGKGVLARQFHFGIYNDYDGGLAFAPEFVSNDHLIMVNASELQGGNAAKAKSLYTHGGTFHGKKCICRSDFYRDPALKKKADIFWNTCDDNKLILTILKLK